MARVRSRVPRPLRPLVGGAVLVAGVRLVDALWRGVTGRPTPVASRELDDQHASEPRVVRDRLAYAMLLGVAERVARRSGLPAEGPAKGSGTTGPNGRSPA